jgi:hypothetical protein
MGNRIRRPLTLALLTLLTVLACGGRALTELGNPGAAGANNVAGSSGNIAGSSNNAAGANSVAGSSNNAAGASNSAGAPQTGTAGSSDGWGQCVYDEDCTVLPRGCCGTFEPVDAGQLVAVNSSFTENYEKTHCPTQLPCPGSLPVSEYDATEKYFRAICFHPPNQPGQCQILDTRGTPYARCATTSECTLREGVACCPECDGQGWVPVNSTINFCSVSTACDPCASAPPPGLKTSCQAGTCRFAPPKR